MQPLVTTLKSRHSLDHCIENSFDYIAYISEKPFSLTFKGKTMKFKPPEKVIISKNLFQSYSCIDYNCSRCCGYFYNIFSPNEMCKIENARDYIKDVITVEGKNYDIFYYGHIKESCQHLKENKCSIHLNNPIHCAFPLVFFDKRRNNRTLTKRVFRRNHCIGSPVKFAVGNDETLKWIAHLVKRVDLFGMEYGLETKADDVISDINEKYKEFRNDQLKMFEEVMQGKRISDFEEVTE
jgi:hypothetical protein